MFVLRLIADTELTADYGRTTRESRNPNTLLKPWAQLAKTNLLCCFIKVTNYFPRNSAVKHKQYHNRAIIGNTLTNESDIFGASHWR